MVPAQSQSQSPRRKVALGISGGIAAYKAAEVLRGLQRAGCLVRVAMTKRACEFVQPLTFRALSGSHVIVDDYAPDNPDPIAHITFSQSVDLFLVVPATANIIAKFANGIPDVLLAPAMNTTMWQQPATRRNLDQLRADGVHILDPDEGEMACGTIGPGRLSDPERIVAAALKILDGLQPSQEKDLSGERLLITVGATREEIDPVRFISNRSSGRMGFAIAEAARKRGAQVTAITGITTVRPPPGIKVIQVFSAAEMSIAVLREIPRASIFIAAAAVADYRPAKRADQKLKKTQSSMTITLEPTPDILSEVVCNRQDGTLVIGFAAETQNVLANARQKLQTKKLDAIVANDVTRGDSGFDSVSNAITIIKRNSDQPLELPLMAKTDAAHHILDEIVSLRQG